MDIEVLNENYQRVAVIDMYRSFIWTDKFCAAGEFELYIPLPSEYLKYMKLDYYLRIEKSEHIMIIQSLATKSDPEDGDFLVVTGESLESILKRRIVWGKKTYSSTSVADIIDNLMDICIVNPTEPADAAERRKIDNFVAKPVTNARAKEKILKERQCNGTNLYETVVSLLEDVKLGFKIILTKELTFEFEVYEGANRTFFQEENQRVIFSPEFDTIVDSIFTYSNMDHKNVALIAGDNDTYATSDDGSFGINRREVYFSSNKNDIVEDGSTSYTDLLQRYGEETLRKDHKVINEFDSKTEPVVGFSYGRDYFLGDYVEINDLYGNIGVARVDEIVFSEDPDEVSNYPKFVIETDERIIGG